MLGTSSLKCCDGVGAETKLAGLSTTVNGERESIVGRKEDGGRNGVRRERKEKG